MWGRTLLKTLLAILVVASFLHVDMHASEAGVLTNLQNDIQNITGEWMNRSLALGGVLFFALMGCTMIMAMCRTALQNNGSLSGFTYTLFDVYLKAIPIYAFMAFFPAFLRTFGAQAADILAQTTGVRLVDAGTIFALGIAMDTNLLKTMLFTYIANGAMLNAAGNVQLLIGLGVTLVILLSFTIIAFEVFFAFVQGYINLSLGAINIGWLGSAGTKSLGESYLAGCWNTIMTIVIMQALAVLIVSFTPQLSAFASETRVDHMLQAWLELAGGTMFLALLSIFTPAYARAMHSGHPAVSAVQVGNRALQLARVA